MNIILVGENFPPTIGGPATYTPKLASELLKKGYDVKVVCYSDASMKNDSYEYDVFRIPFSKFKIGHYIRYTKKLFAISKDADVLYAQGPVSSGLPAVIVAKIRRKKLLIKVVGDYAWEQAQGGNKTELRIDEFQKNEYKGVVGLLQKLERYTVMRADKVIVPSEYLKSLVCGWGVASERIQVVYNAVVQHSHIRSVNKQYDTIVTMGRLVPWKGFAAMIEIMPELLRQNPKFRLLILGTGPEESNLRNLIHKNRMEAYIKIRLVSPKERDVIFSQAKLFVLNTDYEGFSHALLEVMVAGVPIITTNIGGNPELIEDGKNGILINFNDKKMLAKSIIRLARDEERAQRFVNNSTTKVREFTLERMFKETLDIILSV